MDCLKLSLAFDHPFFSTIIYCLSTTCLYILSAQEFTCYVLKEIILLPEVNLFLIFEDHSSIANALELILDF
jgi:hypothetical protein